MEEEECWDGAWFWLGRRGSSAAAMLFALGSAKEEKEDEARSSSSLVRRKKAAIFLVLVRGVDLSGVGVALLPTPQDLPLAG